VEFARVLRAPVVTSTSSLVISYVVDCGQALNGGTNTIGCRFFGFATVGVLSGGRVGAPTVT
jgi:hypothetical protein